jgi:hypothetical protein
MNFLKVEKTPRTGETLLENPSFLELLLWMFDQKESTTCPASDSSRNNIYLPP